MIKNGQFQKILKETSLDIRLKVINEMAFIDLLTKLGYRKDVGWTDEENDILQKLCDHAKDITKWQIKEFEQWEKDGRP